MEQITIHVKNKQKAQALINFLKTMDFIEDVTASDLSTLRPKAKVNAKEFFALAGCRREGSLGEKLQFKSPRAQISVVFDGFLAVFGVFGGVVSLRQGLSDKLLAGLWTGRDVTLDSIRQKAWPTRA